MVDVIRDSSLHCVPLRMTRKKNFIGLKPPSQNWEGLGEGHFFHQNRVRELPATLLAIIHQLNVRSFARN
jgi:hypothetical protein